MDLVTKMGIIGIAEPRSQVARAVPNKCPKGYIQPGLAEECRAANPTKKMENCSEWGKDNPTGPQPPRCFSRTDMDGHFCFKEDGLDETEWGNTLVWCVPHGVNAAEAAAAANVSSSCPKQGAGALLPPTALRSAPAPTPAGRAVPPTPCFPRVIHTSHMTSRDCLVFC